MKRHRNRPAAGWTAYLTETYVLSTLIFIVLGLIGLLFIEKGDVVLWIGNQRSYMVHAIFDYWTVLGEEEIFIGAALVFIVFYSIREGLGVPVVGLLSVVVSHLLKSLFQQPRPIEYFSEEVFAKTNPLEAFHVVSGMNSFPSGHTIGAFAIFGYIALTVKSRIVSGLCFVLALGVGISRVYLINHFFQDIIFGAFVGTLLALIVHLFLDREWLFNRPDWMWISVREWRAQSMSSSDSS